jgi:hypothetical protein
VLEVAMLEGVVDEPLSDRGDDRDHERRAQGDVEKNAAGNGHAAHSAYNQRRWLFS